MNKLCRKLRFNHSTYEVCCTNGYIDIKSLERNKCVFTDFTVMFWFKVTVLTRTCQFRFVVRKIETDLNLDISRLINDEFFW